MSTSKSKDVDLLQAHDFCVSIALKAGAYLREQSAVRAGLRGDDHAPVELTAEIKMSSVDIVTAADMEVRWIVLRTLTQS
jgi:hypothetical protein